MSCISHMSESSSATKSGNLKVTKRSPASISPDGRGGNGNDLSQLMGSDSDLEE